MRKVWTWFNEKKTTIGAALFFAAMLLQKMGEIWLGTESPDWIPKLIESLEWFGGIFSGIGLSHKGVKILERKRQIIQGAG